jgi:predicted glycosyl hydrolase (DUF1957 family)
MLWINFLHLYQPANTDGHIIKEATEFSYRRIAEALLANPKIKFTLNINGSLFLRWKELGYDALISKYGRLLEEGRIELTGTAAYHPLLPLVPKPEIYKQTRENEAILKKSFGGLYDPKGYYMPEMAYSPQAAAMIKKMGFEWIILDEIAYSGKIRQVDPGKKYIDKNSGLNIIFRSRQMSSSYVPEQLGKIIGEEKKPIITATDGELYGLRHKDRRGRFENLLKNENLETKTISEYLSGLEDIENVKIHSCSWESSEDELAKGVPYFLWNNKENKIHQKLWQLAYLSHRTVGRYKNDPNYAWARWHLVRGLASCSFWWASEKDFSHIMGPYAWNPDEIERGTNELIRAVRALDDVATRRTKIKAEQLYIEIKRLVWEKHWTFWKSGRGMIGGK